MTLTVPKLEGAAKPITITVNGQEVQALLYNNALTFNVDTTANRHLEIQLPPNAPTGHASIYVSRPNATETMNRFEIIIFWSAQDQAYIADVPELPGCMAHGDTHEAALAAVKEAAALWLDTARETQRAIPQPRGERLLFA